MRNKPTAWWPLGYIPDLKLNALINEEKQFKVELKSIILHEALKTILKSFIKFQKNEQNVPVSLTIGSITKSNNQGTMFFIIGDIQGGDKMACTSPSYSNKINRLYQKCNVKEKTQGIHIFNIKKSK